MKEINNNFKSDIEYVGSVKVFYRDSKGKYRILNKKNNGCDGLFSFLTRVLQGDIKSELLPRYLSATYLDDNNIELDAFIQKIPLSNNAIRYYNDDLTNKNPAVSDAIEYTFMIPSGSIVKPSQYNSISDNNKPVTYFKLLNSSDNDRLAECAKIDVSSYNIDANQQSNLLVYWRLKFNSGSNN